ncbi:unnamed protein product, partial [Tenebrio molitor]
TSDGNQDSGGGRRREIAQEGTGKILGARNSKRNLATDLSNHARLKETKVDKKILPDLSTQINKTEVSACHLNI